MLIPYEEALARVLKAAHPVDRRGESTSLSHPWPMRVLAEQIVATGPHPRFDNSAVDGYALLSNDLARVGQQLPIAFTIATGPPSEAFLAPGTVARIFTGAQLPTGTTGVAMQEDVDTEGGCVTLREAVQEGAGVRRAGTDFKEGDLLVDPGAPITPGIAGLLASQGVTRPPVLALPRVIVITTGDEIVAPDCEPGPGQLRDSIGAMLTHAAGSYAVVHTAYTPDDPIRLRETLSTATQHADAVVIAGGASVGDRDFTASVVAELGEVEFHGINVRPGKPLLFGLINGKPILGLPGNPASAFVCFHLFGVPLLKRLGGRREPNHLWFEVPYGATHQPESRDVFARVTISDGVATPVLEQASFGLRALGVAQALARLPANTAVGEGQPVQITLL